MSPGNMSRGKAPKCVHSGRQHPDPRAPGSLTLAVSSWGVASDCPVLTEQALVVQTVESFEQAKVFKAHAVPQGLCANLINALKLLANQQEDGDGLLQNIVTNLGKGSRKGVTRLGGWRATPRHGNFKVRKSKVPEAGSDVTIKDSLDELTLKGGRSEHLEGVHRCQPH